MVDAKHSVETPDVPARGASKRLQDTRIAVIGNVDSGKSTMVGVLTSGKADDGRGSARSSIFRHDHERETGRTSSPSKHIMGFDEKNDPVYLKLHASASARQKDTAWQWVVDKSKRIVSFNDLAGHERYLKTTLAGLTGCFPDFAMVVVGANMGVSNMTLQHLTAACAMDIPIFVVVTKTDMCPTKVLCRTLKALLEHLRSAKCGNKKPMLIKKESKIDQILTADPGLTKFCPVFLCSAVTRKNINLIESFLAQLRPQKPWNISASTTASTHVAKTVLVVDETFTVKGVGTVLAGTVTHGRVTVGQKLCLGPFSDGSHKVVTIRSIESKRVPVSDAVAGETCCVAIRFKNAREKVDRAQIRRGMVLIDEKNVTKPVTRFKTQVSILHHATTIKVDYEAVLQCGNLSQIVVVEKIDGVRDNKLRSGDVAEVTCRFKWRPEYLDVGTRMILREGNPKCVGRVMEVIG